MKHLGHIKIKGNKIVFVYHELPKPDLDDYKKDSTWGYAEYYANLDKYNASRREVEVSNMDLMFPKYAVFSDRRQGGNYNTGQPCEANIENNKAIIIKILYKWDLRKNNYNRQ